MGEIRALTGLRGIAAIIVFFAHTRDTLQSRGLPLEVPSPIVRLFLSGGRQVDIFFVLSGFILALIYRDWFRGGVTKKSYVKFIQRRFARIYPLHAFMLLLTIAFVYAAYVSHANVLNGLERFNTSSLPAYFLLVQAWGFFGTDPGTWNPPAWSVSIEALAYLVFPFFLWLSFGLQKTRPFALFVGIAVCGFALNAVTTWGLAGVPGVSRGLSEFALGCATVGLCDGALARWLKSEWGGALALAALLVCFALTADTGFWIGLFTAPLLIALCGNNSASRLFGHRIIYFLGEISFSIYLGHFLFSTIAYRLVSVAWMRTGPVALLIGLCGITLFVVAASTLTYFAVERPGRDLLRGRKAPPPPERIQTA